MPIFNPAEYKYSFIGALMMEVIERLYSGSILKLNLSVIAQSIPKPAITEKLIFVNAEDVFVELLFSGFLSLYSNLDVVFCAIKIVVETPAVIKNLIFSVRI